MQAEFCGERRREMLIVTNGAREPHRHQRQPETSQHQRSLYFIVLITFTFRIRERTTARCDAMLRCVLLRIPFPL